MFPMKNCKQRGIVFFELLGGSYDKGSILADDYYEAIQVVIGPLGRDLRSRKFDGISADIINAHNNLKKQKSMGLLENGALIHLDNLINLVELYNKN